MLTKLSWLIFEKLNWLNLFSVCVYVFGIHVLKIVVESWFWELKMLIEFLIELHAWLHSYLYFSLLEKQVFSNLDTWLICQALELFLITILTDPQQLSGFIKKVLEPLIASQQLVDRSRFCSCVFALFLDTFSIAASVDVVFMDTFLDRWLDTSWHLYLLRFTDLLYKGPTRFGSHFSRFLSR